MNPLTELAINSRSTLTTSLQKNAAKTADYPHSGREINIRPLSSSHRRFPQSLRLLSVLEVSLPADGAGVQGTLKKESWWGLGSSE